MKKITLLLLLIATSLTGFSQQIFNHTFDLDVQGWVANAGTATVSHSATFGNATLGALKLDVTANNNRAAFDATVSGAGDYTLTFKVKTTTTGTVKLKALIRKDGSNISGATLTLTALDPGDNSGVWDTYSHTFTLAAGSDAVNVRIQEIAPNDTATYYIDDVVFTKEPCTGFAVTTAVVGGGTNVITTPLPCYPDGSSVEFTATPTPHWNFDSWSGAMTGTTNPQTLVTSGSADATVTANFTIDPAFTYDFAFDTDGDQEGWAVEAGATIGTHTGSLVTLVPEADKYFRFSLSNFPIPATQKFLQIKMQNLSTNDNEMRITVGGGAAIVWQITTSDAATVTYEIDLSTLANWDGSGQKIGIRFQDATLSGKSSNTGNIIIDDITFATTTLSVNDVNFRDDASITLYPNPVNDVLTINSPLAIEKVEVFNLLGQKTMTAATATVDASGLAKGMYLVKIYQENDVISTKRFIKQ